MVAHDLPRSTWLDLGQTVVLPGGPDVAVVAPGLNVELEDDRVEVEAFEPGAVRGGAALGPGHDGVRARPGPPTSTTSSTPASGRCSPARPPRPARCGSRTPTRACSCRTPSPAARPARRTSSPTPSSCWPASWSSGWTDRRAEAGEPGPSIPLTLAFLAREADRTVEESTGTALLDVAVARLRRTTAPVPGLGLAGVGLALALVRAGRSATDVVAHLDALRTAGGGSDDVHLELALLLRPREEVAGDVVLAALHRLAVSLGAGLPGRVVPAAALAAVAYASTLLGLVDEPTGQRLQDRWGVTAGPGWRG